VELGRNMGTTVPRNRPPRPAYKVPQGSFAFVERAPYFQQMSDGLRSYVFPGTDGHHWEQELELPQRQAIRDALDDDQQLICDFGPEPQSQRGTRRFGIQSIRSAGPRSLLFGQNSSQTPTPERLFQPQVLSRPDPDDRRKNQVWRFEPYALGTNDDDVLGSRIRYQAVSGDIYTELGYRYQLVNGQSEHDLSEAFFQTRGKWGQLTAGRQHLFLGPANNTRVGTLLDLESSDTILYEAPIKGRFRQMGGYVIDSDVFQDGGFSGGFLRGQAALWGGNAGYSVLFNRDSETNIGWSLDAAQPVVKNVLDVYGEAGVDSHNREIYTAGIYVPWLFHRHKLDVYFEYGRREDLDERVTFRIRRELGGGLLAIAFLDQRLGSNHLVGGGGILWSKAFR
jgi:hypothetical protein